MQQLTQQISRARHLCGLNELIPGLHGKVLGAASPQLGGPGRAVKCNVGQGGPKNEWSIKSGRISPRSGPLGNCPIKLGVIRKSRNQDTGKPWEARAFVYHLYFALFNSVQKHNSVLPLT